MAKGGPGKSYRKGISVMEMAEMFGTETAAVEWFEGAALAGRRDMLLAVRGIGRLPGHEREADAVSVPGLREVFQPQDRDGYGGLEAAAAAVGMGDLFGDDEPEGRIVGEAGPGPEDPSGIRVVHAAPIREAFVDVAMVFEGPVEVDETYFGGRERNKHEGKKQKAGRGPVGKTAVVGVKDRATKRVVAKVVERTDRETLQGFVRTHTATGAKVYTDEARAYEGLENREAVKHSVGEYVREMAHTNGVESFWSMLKRAHKGVYHKLSPKHLQRYVSEFAGRQNIREMDTAVQMAHVVAAMVGRRLMYRDLIA